MDIVLSKNCVFKISDVQILFNIKICKAIQLKSQKIRSENRTSKLESQKKSTRFSKNLGLG